MDALEVRGDGHALGVDLRHPVPFALRKHHELPGLVGDDVVADVQRAPAIRQAPHGHELLPGAVSMSCALCARWQDVPPARAHDAAANARVLETQEHGLSEPTLADPASVCLPTATEDVMGGVARGIHDAQKTKPLECLGAPDCV